MWVKNFSLCHRGAGEPTQALLWLIGEVDSASSKSYILHSLSQSILRPLSFILRGDWNISRTRPSRPSKKIHSEYDLFSIPATSSEVERVFSSSKRLITVDRRFEIAIGLRDSEAVEACESPRTLVEGRPCTVN